MKIIVSIFLNFQILFEYNIYRREKKEKNKDRNQEKDKSNKSRDDVSGEDDHDWTRPPFNSSRNNRKPNITATIQRSSNYRHDIPESRTYSDSSNDRWTMQRDRFSSNEHKRERFDGYSRVLSTNYHRDRDHGRQGEKRK